MTAVVSLEGLRVLVTRPAHQAESLCEKLEATGAKPIRFPVLAIESLAESEGVQTAIGRLLQQDLLVFTSPNAVHCAMQALQFAGLAWPDPQPVEVAAIGRATAEALEKQGVNVAVCPDGPYTSEGLLAHPRLHRVRGQRTMLIGGVGGRELLADTLRERGAEVDSLAVYRRVRPQADALALTEALLEKELDVTVVTSVEALENLLALAGEEGRAELLSIGLVTVSGRVATAARVRGFHGGICVAPEASDGGLIEGIRRWRDQRQQTGSSMTDDKRNTESEAASDQYERPEQGGEGHQDTENIEQPDQVETGDAESLPATSDQDGGDGGEPPEEPPPEEKPARDNRPTLILILLFFIIVFGAGGGWWLYDRQEALMVGLEDRASANDLAELRDSAVSRAERLAGRVDNLAAEHQAHIQHLAGAEEAVAQLRETQSRAREQMERLETLAGSQRSDWIQSEADYLFRVARSRAVYHQDVQGALAALRNADALLGELGGDGADRRRDVRAAIEALVDVPRVDRGELSAELHRLIRGVDDWPVAELTQRLEARPIEGDRDADLGSLAGLQEAGARAWQQVKASLSSLVVVRREDAPPALLSPDEEWFLREHIRIQLLTARLALLERDEESYRSSLEQAERWTEQYFRDSDAVRQAVSRMRELRERTIAPSLPDLDDLLGDAAGGEDA